MPSLKFHCRLFGLAAALLLPGCSGSSDDLDNVIEQGNANSPSEFTDGLTMTIGTYNKRQGDYETPRFIKAPDEAEVKKQFQSLEWTDPNLRPFIKCVRLKEGNIVGLFAVRRTEETAEGDIQAEWLNSDKNEYILPKIESPETALNLLLLFHGDKPELERAVEWKPLN